MAEIAGLGFFVLMLAAIGGVALWGRPSGPRRLPLDPANIRDGKIDLNAPETDDPMVLLRNARQK